MSLFAKAKPAAPKAEQLPLETPPYYEVWGTLESANRALWVGLWFAVTVALLEFLVMRVALRRPPVVIRVDDAGQAQVVADPSRQPPVSEAEIKNFLTLFEKFFTELNCYTYDADLKVAYSMMTSEFQSKASDLFKRGGLLETLKGNQAKTALTITEIHILKDTPQVLDCRVKGYREIDSYKTDGTKSEVVFEDDVILKKVPRSAATPYGVLVQDWSESVFKK
ncbi:MAG: hypothetical protein KGK30_03570 [Elusimicrobia bacterium]|nr:hypothetical protein [Elusimicrobiota bacterium]